MPLIDPGNAVTSVASLGESMIIAQDRHGASTLRKLLAALGKTDGGYLSTASGGAGLGLDAPASILNASTATAIIRGIAAADGVAPSDADIAAGLAAIGIVARTAPMQFVRRTRR